MQSKFVVPPPDNTKPYFKRIYSLTIGQQPVTVAVKSPSRLDCSAILEVSSDNPGLSYDVAQAITSRFRNQMQKKKYNYSAHYDADKNKQEPQCCSFSGDATINWIQKPITGKEILDELFDAADPYLRGQYTSGAAGSFSMTEEYSVTVTIEKSPFPSLYSQKVQLPLSVQYDEAKESITVCFENEQCMPQETKYLESVRDNVAKSLDGFYSPATIRNGTLEYSGLGVSGARQEQKPAPSRLLEVIVDEVGGRPVRDPSFRMIKPNGVLSSPSGRFKL